MDVNEKFDLILAYNFRMSTLFLINYHFKRINFCIKFESALQPHSPLSLRFSDDIAVSPHTDHRLSVSDSDNLRRSEEIGFLHILTFQQMLRQNRHRHVI